MSRHGRGAALPLSAVLLMLALGCGDDTAPSVRGNPGDSGDDDSGLDADTPVRDATVIDGNVAPGDGDGDGDMPDATLDDDADVPTCRQDCAALRTECMDALCNDRTLECETFPKADGLACGSQELSTCSAPDTCEAGLCEPHHEDEDVPCGDQGVLCHLDDACDGEGQCGDGGLREVGSACGDPTDTECNAADSCNAAGECAPNYADAEAPCGDQDETCRFDDACDGNGACVDRGLWEPGHCPAGSEIGPDGLCGCGRASGTSACMPGPDVCVGEVCVLGHERYAYRHTPGLTTTNGLSCGSAANTQCDNPDSCEEGVCSTHAEPTSTPCGSAASSACNAADSCDGFGNCGANLAAVSTVCGTAPSECMEAPRCDALGACQPGSIVDIGTPCGDQTVGVCNAANTCNAMGVCANNYATPGTVCGDADNECAAPDTCNASGVCIPGGNAPAGEPCGDESVGECDLADQCNGNGACVPNNVLPGTVCGATPGACTEPSTCAAGQCVAGEIDDQCTVDVTITVLDGETDEPIEGVTVSVVASSPLESGVSDAAGQVVLAMPAGVVSVLSAAPTVTYWGLRTPALIIPGDTNTMLLTLFDDAAVAAQYDAAGVANVNPARGILDLRFFGETSAGGGESATLTPSCAASSCGPVTQNASAANVVSSDVLAGGAPRLSFINVLAGTLTVDVDGTTGNTCTLYDGQTPIEASARTITDLAASCASL